MNNAVTDYTANLIRKLEQAAVEEIYPKASVFYVRNYGKTIRMVYQDKDAAELAKDGCRKYLVPEATDYAATFIHWKADFRKYLPPDCNIIVANTHIRCRVVYNYLFTCADYDHQVYYYCQAPQARFLGAHTMVIPYYQWGLQNGLIFTHSASVGINGKGALLVANGGGGKSTLSVTCLMDGLDFISDDYTMLTKTGELEALPVYSNIGLTPESYDMLKPPYPVHWINKLNKDKRFMDIAGVKNFKDRLKIKTLVAPKLTAGETKIYEIDVAPLIFGFYRSSMKQVVAYGNQEYLASFFERLKHLKAYQLELGRDVHYNAEFLRNFINGLD